MWNSENSRTRLVSVAFPLALAAAVLVGCSAEEPPSPGSQAIAPQPEPAKPKARKARYEPKYSPEIEQLLVDVRFLPDDDPATIPKLRELLGDDHLAVREEAVAKLEDIGSEEAIVLLGDTLVGDPATEVRLRAVEGLDFVGGEVAADQLLRGLADPEADVREAAAESLLQQAGPRHVEALRAALEKEGDREVRTDLEHALDALGAEAGDA